MPDDIPVHQVAQDPLRSRARRLTWTCGLALAMLLLLGISGLAGVTLLYVSSPLHGPRVSAYQPLPPFEETVVKSVIALKPGIQILHRYGGYVTVLLSAAAALQCISLGGTLAASDDQARRGRGRLVRMFGGVGGFALALAVLAQIAAGSFMSWGMRTLDEGFARGAQAPAISVMDNVGAGADGSRAEVVASLHTRELNYPAGLAALMVLAAMALARSATEKPAPQAKE